MQQFFFDIADDDAPKSVGPVELGNDDEAREYAIGLMKTIFHRPDTADPTGSVGICDKDGKVINARRAGKG